MSAQMSKDVFRTPGRLTAASVASIVLGLSVFPARGLVQLLGLGDPMRDAPATLLMAAGCLLSLAGFVWWAKNARALRLAGRAPLTLCFLTLAGLFAAWLAGVVAGGGLSESGGVDPELIAALVVICLVGAIASHLWQRRVR